jgi:hypothetical protein
MTATGFRFTDTYQAVAHKALRHLCQLYEEPIARTPMRFFPPREKNRSTWIAHMEALQAQEDNPAMKYMTDYLLSLDEQYNVQAAGLRNCISCTQMAVVYARSLHVQLTEAQARATTTESHETAITEAPRTTEERHAEQLRTTYLITRPKQRTPDVDGQEPVILEGIPIHPPERRRMDPAVPPAPPPSEVSNVELLLPLTQPPPREEEDPQPSASAEGPQDPRNEAVQSDKED